MEKYSFDAYSVCPEINFNLVARHFGIDKKYKWEEFLTLGETELKGVIPNPAGKSIKIFPFGSVVFINLAHNEIMDIVGYLAKVEAGIAAALGVEGLACHDNYELIVDSGADPSVSFDRLVTGRLRQQVDAVSIILAKSVALERVERDITKLVDESEGIIGLLERGKVGTRDKELVRISARIMKFRHNTISYIMLLDKPDVAWKDQETDELLEELAHIFELEDRYKSFSSKTDTLMEIVDVFTNLLNTRKGVRLEYAVIGLILIEVIITILEKTGLIR